MKNNGSTKKSSKNNSINEKGKKSEMYVISNNIDKYFEQEEKNKSADVKYFNEIILNRNTRVVFQPIVDVESNSILAYEALSRCPRKVTTDKSLTPFRVISKKDHNVLDQICLDNIFQKLDKVPVDGPYIFINCSLSNIDYLKATNLSKKEKEKIVIEFDLNNKIYDVNSLIKQVNELKSKNFSIAIDDIGETETDFNLIRQIGPEFVKVDISIIKNISTVEENQKYLKSFMSLAYDINSAVIVEGVETKEDLEKVVELGCQYIQGFYFSKPIDFIPSEKDIIKKIFKKAV